DEECHEVGQSLMMDYPPPKPSKDEQKLQAMRKVTEEEREKLQSELDQKLKALQDQFKKEYQDAHNKLKQEHTASLNKLKDEEKKRVESSKEEFKNSTEVELKKVIENLKKNFEKDNAEKKAAVLKQLEEKYNAEIEKAKLEFVQDMKDKKGKLQREHEEEMQDLEVELKALYEKEKSNKQSELESLSTSVKRNKIAKAQSAIADMEFSMSEILRERQTTIRREHNKQLAILAEELEKELENAARLAKEEETVEKNAHAAKLIRMKENHDAEILRLQEFYDQSVKTLEMQHVENLSKLKSDFKVELTLQKTDLENKLTELQIEYDKKITDFAEEQIDDSEGKHEELNNTFSRKEGEGNDVQEPNDEGIVKSVLITEEERKYDQILKELKERRKSLENDLEELKNQEAQVRELKNKTILPSSACSKKECIHEAKYNKMKAKYSNLVSRIKSEKAKKDLKKKEDNDCPHSVSYDKTSTEDIVNGSDAGQHSDDLTSSIQSSPQHLSAHGNNLKSMSDASEDEERFASQVLKRYGKFADFGSTRNISHISHSSVGLNIKCSPTKPLTSTPKKAWIEDDLLAHGRRELTKTEKFLKMKNPKYYPASRDLQVDDIRRELFQQSSNYRAQAKIKDTVRRYSLAPAGSLTSDTEESDEPTHDAPSSDFGLDQIL
ncbi:hypothetical protein SK128_004327, partial [Halocaridina rubra]